MLTTITDPQTLGFSPERLQRIGTALNSEIAAKRLPGAVLAIARGGELAYYESFGISIRLRARRCARTRYSASLR